MKVENTLEENSALGQLIKAELFFTFKVLKRKGTSIRKSMEYKALINIFCVIYVSIKKDYERLLQASHRDRNQSTHGS